MELQNTQMMSVALADAYQEAISRRHEFITPEHLLYAFLKQEALIASLQSCFADPDALKQELEDYLTYQVEPIPAGTQVTINISEQLSQAVQMARLQLESSDKEKIDVPHIIQAILHLPESWANYFLQKYLPEDVTEFFSVLITEYEEEERRFLGEESSDRDDTEEVYDAESEDAESYGKSHKKKKRQSWKNFVVCLNERVESHNPLIGRERELEQTIRVLCRKDKNNPLHIGESGVGKTALVYGLAERIIRNQVPKRLKDAQIYELDLGGLVAGTQYRGDFEKRLKTIMEGIQKEENALVYIDEIHNLVGAGRTGNDSLDASNLLKPYLEGGNIRFIGSTTYEEYNRYLSGSKGLMRRFQQIDILEPSIPETVSIIEGLIDKYADFHQVTYEKGVVEYAVKASAQFIHDRFLPDKAIDLIDEAGAYRELHPSKDGKQTVDKDLIQEILARMCKVDSLVIREENSEQLESLGERIGKKIFGQDEAVQAVAESILMSKAGLTEENKPVASLLFVGPTGVGKTEVARVLAQEMGIPLLRFDMSEYTEKHTVAKLIGSPAGYVGYDDGGLLTDAIRKSPHCVLLLDEIEKAHPDIFNILLQVMDYAVLTDNKGRKSDCRHLVLIMTSNAGAQYAHQNSVGFNKTVSAGQAMMKQVKRTFKPEFLNRLSGTVVFHDMDEKMATAILNKKIGELNEKLQSKDVRMRIEDEALQWILRQSITREYGAREMDRVLASRLKPMLMKEILFGKLKQGGSVCVGVNQDELCLKNIRPAKGKNKINTASDQ